MKILVDLFFKVTIEGKENIPPPEKDNVLIVANHSSYLDIAIVARVFYNNLLNLAWVISRENAKYWFLKWLFILFKVIVVNGTVAKAIKALKAKRWVVIFPEGAREWYLLGQAEKVKVGTGTAAIVLSTGALMIPVGISGTSRILAPNSFKLEPILKCALDPLYTIKIHIGKPIVFPARTEKRIDGALLREATEEIMQQVAVLIPC